MAPKVPQPQVGFVYRRLPTSTGRTQRRPEPMTTLVVSPLKRASINMMCNVIQNWIAQGQENYAYSATRPAARMARYIRKAEGREYIDDSASEVPIRILGAGSREPVQTSWGRRWRLQVHGLGVQVPR